MQVDIIFLLTLFTTIKDCCQHTGLAMFQERIKIFLSIGKALLISNLPKVYSINSSLFNYSCTKHLTFLLPLDDLESVVKGGSVTGKIKTFLAFSPTSIT